MKNDALEQYLNAVGVAISGSKAHRRKVLEDLRTELTDQFGSTAVTYDQLLSELGSPEEVAERFSSANERSVQRKTQKRTIRWLFTAAIILLIACAVAVGIAAWYSQGHITETIIIYAETTGP